MEFLLSLFPNPEDNFPLIAVILGLPLLGALINGIFGRRLGPDGVRTMALSAVGGSFLASVAAFTLLYFRVQEAAAGLAEGAPVPHVKFVWNAWRWVALETTSIDVVFSIDSLSATMMLVVTGVGGLIHLYSTGYMAGDPSYHRFFAYLNLFIFSMLVLILGDNLPILFVGWEGVGLCSYLLIGFWFESDKNASAGKKAFITNRIGDFGLLVAMAMILHTTGSLSWTGIEARAPELFNELQIWPIGAAPAWLPDALSGPVIVSYATLIGLALFLGCAGKSAQIPLYVWLPDAMAGPTPVSALIHAATMVTAGVYLVARMSFVFVLSPTAMMVVAGIGALTALFAATIGLVQHDIKKVLAYSTVSQLGFMFMGVGVGAFAAGMFHVVTHAFFKACLFLCAGSVIHAMHARVHDTDASQDMRNMGGLRKYMPYTFWTYVAATAAIIGLPLTAGFFSKDEILFRTFVNRIQASGLLKDLALRNAMEKTGGQLSPEAREAVIQGLQIPEWFSTGVFVVGVTAAILTAFYMMRTVFLTFYGDFRGWRIVPGWKDPHAGHGHHDHHDKPADGPVPHESPWTMWVPLVVLAFFALFVGWLNAGPFHLTPFAHWLEPSMQSGLKLVTTIKEGEELTKLEHLLLIPGVLAFLIGSVGAYWVYYVKGGEPARQAAKAAGGLYRLVLDKWRIDELYEATVLGAVDSLAETAALFDKWVIDGVLARLTALVVQSFGSLFRSFQTGRVQMYAAVMVVGLFAMGAFFATAHGELVVSKDEPGGMYVVEAAPGLGYKYRWDRDGDGTWDNPRLEQDETWTLLQKVQVKVPPGEEMKVRVEVQNVFNMTEVKEIVLRRPLPDKSKPDQVGMTVPIEVSP
jgi:NADH-quinone oxidoreductase subunit L